jgi:hypothetical protein
MRKWTRSNGEEIDIEDMNPYHLMNALRKADREDLDILEDLLEEAEYRGLVERDGLNYIELEIE